jgi:tetratricopeptide (TPR) repeat protein
MISDFENARRYFSKATTIDHRFAPAWVGFGHAFAAQDESDQAMAAYRTASRLFPGSHIPWLGIGMEYLRTNHLHLALQYIRQAQEISPVEPLVLHELVCPQATHNRRVPRLTQPMHSHACPTHHCRAVRRHAAHAALRVAHVGVRASQGVLHYLNNEYDDAISYFLQVAENCTEYDETVRAPRPRALPAVLSSLHPSCVDAHDRVRWRCRCASQPSSTWDTPTARSATLTTRPLVRGRGA